MAYDPLALADVIGDGLDLSDIEVSDLLQATPLLDALPMEESSNGTVHSYAKETGAPVVGFRAINAGRDLDSSTESQVDVTLKYLDFSWDVDEALAKACKKGPEWLIAREGARHLKAALKKFEMQLINGVIGASDSASASGDSAGFTGFRDAATVDALADVLHVVDATGSTADTASSVFGVRVGMSGVTGIYKGDGPALQLGDTTVIQKVVNPGTDNKTYPAYYTPAGIWLAVQIASVWDISRIVNLTAQAGKGLTDSLLSQLVELSPVGMGPSHLIMSRRSRGQLQRSRTTYSPTGSPAPLPSEYEGIPILVTDSVSNTEELVA